MKESKLIKSKYTLQKYHLENITKHEVKEQLVIRMINEYVSELTESELDEMFNITEKESFNGITFECEMIIKKD